MSQDNETANVGRRSFLQGTMAAGLLGGGLTAQAAGETTSRFVVEQDGTKIPISPLSHGDTSVADFYDYGGDGHAHSVTDTGIERSDTSLLFLYEDADGISLGIIHDAPHDSGGGEAAFDISGLPDAGTWTLEDDPSHAPDNFGRTRATWRWGSKNTDGGVFSGFETLRSGTETVPFADKLAIQTEGSGEKIPLTNGWHYVKKYTDTTIEGVEPPLYVIVFADNAPFDDPVPDDHPQKGYTIENGSIVPEVTPSGYQDDAYFVLKPGTEQSELTFVDATSANHNAIWFGDQQLIADTKDTSSGTTFTLPGVTEDVVTISPSFSYGISSWEVLSGDAENPSRTELDLTKPITIRRTGGPSDPGVDLDRLANEKLGLAKRIDTLSDGFTNDAARVKPTLRNLQAAASDSTLTPQQAADRIDRMKLGESIAESVFTGAFPYNERTNDDFAVPRRSYAYTGGPVAFVNRASNVVVSKVTDLFLIAAFSGAVLKRIPKLGSALGSFTRYLRDGIESVLEYVGKHSDLISKNDQLLEHLLEETQKIAEAGLDIVLSGGKEAASAYAESKDKKSGPLEDLTSDYLIGRGLTDDETHDGDSIRTLQNSLAHLDDSLSADRTDGFFYSVSQAARRANLRRFDVADHYYAVDALLTEQLQILNAINVIGNIIEIAGLLGSWFLGIGQILMLVGTLMQAAGSILQGFVASIDAIEAVKLGRIELHRGVDSIVR